MSTISIIACVIVKVNFSLFDRIDMPEMEDFLPLLFSGSPDQMISSL